VRLELCTPDRPGLLAFVTRTFRENGLSVTRADVNTKGQTAMNVFYVTDAWGHMPEQKILDAVVQRIGGESLKVKEEPRQRYCSGSAASEGGTGLLSIGSIVWKKIWA
jgi:UTP:GlnB (protein PII) uridylyltransferase